MLPKTIPSYLYQEYSDDLDIQAFVAGYNLMTQEYLDWFTSVNLPIYTGLNGDLLDWASQGLYGYARPSLPAGSVTIKGGYNISEFNQTPLNTLIRSGFSTYYVTTDDIYKRCITWNFFKDDGGQFNVRWLKRRIARFLYGADGVDFGADDTSRISVNFGYSGTITAPTPARTRRVTGGAFYNGQELNKGTFNFVRSAIIPDSTTKQVPQFDVVGINITKGKRTVTGGAFFNGMGFNLLPIQGPTAIEGGSMITTMPLTMGDVFDPNAFVNIPVGSIIGEKRIPLNSLTSTYVAYDPIPMASILQAGIKSGALALPFQFTYIVQI